VLCAWLKEPGEAYQKGEALCEIECDKVVRQLTADGDGVLCAQLTEEGDALAPGAVFAEVDA
jgi:2-oxoglutarate dehydrogenase E2 component (dihydrolipoamide succinyltransferase)